MSKLNVKEFNEDFMGKRVRSRAGFMKMNTRKTTTSKFARDWVSVPWDIEGWVIGVRWLQEGFVEYGRFDEPNHFVETGPRTLCYLVVVDSRHKPIPVPPDAIEVIK